MKFANVIVDISHEKLDRPFGYIIPDELEKEITVGTAVTIPFGKGNRQIKGYVIEITDQPSFDISKMKEIMAVEEGSAKVESQLINLAYWIKENYGSTMNQALKTVIPVKNKIRNIEKKTIVLNLNSEQLEEKIKQFFEEHEDEEIVVASVPLLFEENMQNLFDRTVLVCADKKVRLQRLMNRNGYPLEHALERINAQVSQEEKRNMADFIIENNNNLIELETQIEKTLERLWL